MIAGVGAGVAAAAAVGQMVVAAVALGQQDAGQEHTGKEIAAIKQDLKRTQEMLRRHGLDTHNVPSSSKEQRAETRQIASKQ